MIRVLIADDEVKVSQLICNLIDWQALDMQIVGVAHNGLEALDMIESATPDLVITDIRMPGCDGLEIARRAKEKNSALEFIIISGYRHFDYARTAMQYGVSDYLLKPINKGDLTATLEKIHWKYMHRTQQLSHEAKLKYRLQSDIDRLRAGLLALVQAEYNDAAALELGRVNQEYHYAMRPGVFQAVFVKIDGDESALLPGGMELVKEKCIDALKEQLEPICYDLGLFLQATGVVAVCNFAIDAQPEMRKQLQALVSELRYLKGMFPDVVFTVALGSEEAESAGLHRSYQIAGENAEQRLIAGSGGLIEGESCVSGLAQAGSLLPDAVRLLEKGLELMDAAEVNAAVEHFAKEVLGAKALCGRDIQYLASELCSNYLVLARRLQLHIQDTETFYDTFRRRADLCATAEQVMGCLAAMIADSMQRAVDQRKNEDARPIRTAKQYILAHYMQPITLEDVSKEVGFNASYFSSLFKKESGRNFLEYLSEVRMNKAKELLRETDMPIAQICEAVGYLDIKYFNKTFKKAAGIKPSEFRKLYS